MDGEPLSVAEVAGLLQVSPGTISRWMRAGQLPGTKDRGRWHTTRQELNDWMELHLSR